MTAAPSDVRYGTMQDALVAAFPELGVCYQRLFDDWDNFGGEPPGQYIVFNDILGTLGEILMALPEQTRGRAQLMERFFAFTELLLSSEDEVKWVGMDVLEGVIPASWAGRRAVREFAGLEVRRWWKSERKYFFLPGRDDAYDEIIDLWGVRGAIAPVLLETPPHEIPGISYPKDYAAVRSLEEAKREPEGTVMLSAFGTSHPFVVCRAALVSAHEDALDQAAREIANHLGGENPQGEPSVKYRLIPRGERVWQMNVGGERHCRLWDEPWIADELQPSRGSIVDLLTGRTTTLDSTT